MNHKKNKFATSKAYNPKSKKSAHYIDKEELFNAVVKYKAEKQAAIDAGEPIPKIPEYIGNAILTIAKKMAESVNFRRYDFKEDMVMDGVKNCIKYFDNFDPAKSHNPFSYWSQICYYGFIQRIGKERDRIYNDYQLRNSAKFAVIQEFGYLDGNDLDNGHGEDGLDQSTYGETVAMETFVAKYESARERKKAKQAAAKSAETAEKDEPRKLP